MTQTQTGDLKPGSLPIRSIAYISIFIALSAVGAMVKIPSPVGTIGFDSAPGYFCALAFGYLEGVAVIAIGHLLTSGLMGFPLGLPLHLFIALQMVAWAVVYKWIKDNVGLVAGAVAVAFLNGVVSSFTMFFVGGMGAVIAIMPFLAAGSLANVVLSAIAYQAARSGKLV